MAGAQQAKPSEAQEGEERVRLWETPVRTSSRLQASDLLAQICAIAARSSPFDRRPSHQ